MSSYNKNDNTFDRKEYVITDEGCQTLLCLTCPFHFLPVIPGIMGTKRLILDEEEAYYEVKNGCCDYNSRRPYGELGSVDKVNCLCCTGVDSDLFKIIPVFPGDNTTVEEIVKELKDRMKQRGDTGQIRKLEQVIKETQSLQKEMKELRHDMKLIMEHFNISSNPPRMER